MFDAETVARIANLGSQADGALIHEDAITKRVVFLNEKHGEQGCGFEVLEIEAATRDARGQLLTPPARVTGKVLIQTADSLVDYIKRFSRPGVTLFANIAENRIVAALDYAVDGNTPAFNENTATLNLPYSEEWKYWTGINDKWFSQLEFARLLRENAADISAPDAATIAESVRDLQAVRNVNFTRAVRVSSEVENFEYVDETNVKGSIPMSDAFTLRIPIYFGGPSYTVQAFLRWNVEGKDLKLGIQLHRAEHLRQAVFKEAVVDISDRADAPYVYGAQTTS